MLRRWHRLLAPFFAAFLLLIGLTGVAIQVTDIMGHSLSAPQHPGLTGQPRRSALRQWNHWLKTVHSGEIIGVGGQTLGLLSGVAFCYLAGSGLWMYLDMERRRRRSRKRTGKP